MFVYTDLCNVTRVTHMFHTTTKAFVRPYISLFLSISLMPISFRLPVCPFACLSIFMPIYPFVSPSLGLPYLSLCLHIYFLPLPPSFFLSLSLPPLSLSLINILISVDRIKVAARADGTGHFLFDTPCDLSLSFSPLSISLSFSLFLFLSLSLSLSIYIYIYIIHLYLLVCVVHFNGALSLLYCSLSCIFLQE